MHPVIRILCLLIAAGFLARGGWEQVGLLAALLAALILGFDRDRRGGYLRSLRRLRFLLLSIAIAYGWFSPGEPLLPVLGDWSPVREGLLEGMLRASALAVLALAVHLLLAVTDRESLIAAITWWARPLGGIGLPPERLALRLTLAMEAVPQLREMVAAGRERAREQSPLRRIGAFAAGVFDATLAAAEVEPLPRIAVPTLAPPHALQWLVPAALTVVLVMIR